MIERRFETKEEREQTDILAEEAEYDELVLVIDSCRKRGKAVDLERANVYEEALRNRKDN